jgi:YtkA-like
MKPFAVTPVLVFLLACGPAPVANELALRASGKNGTVRVELHSAEPLHVGQNQVRYRVTADGQLVTHAALTQHPMMDMGTMQHSCPVLDPALEPGDDGLFAGLLMFTMPSMDDAHWSLDVDLARDGAPLTLSLGEVTVADSSLKQVMTHDGRRLTLTVGFSTAPHVGSNELIVTAHQPHDAMMMAFDAATDLAFSMTPEMPAMGHGSAHNVAPTLGPDGLYRGTVNFSMPGEWVVHLGVTQGDVTFGSWDVAFSL